MLRFLVPDGRMRVATLVTRDGRPKALAVLENKSEGRPLHNANACCAEVRRLL